MRTPDAAVRVALAHAEHPDSTHRTTLATPGRQWATFLHTVKIDELHP